MSKISKAVKSTRMLKKQLHTHVNYPEL